MHNLKKMREETDGWQKNTHDTFFRAENENHQKLQFTRATLAETAFITSLKFFWFEWGHKSKFNLESSEIWPFFGKFFQETEILCYDCETFTRSR